MKLFLLRHGDADWPDWDRPDDERPLTKKGHKQARKVGKMLAKTDYAPTVILSSPLPRALETARDVGEELGLTPTIEPALAPGLDLSGLSGLLKAHQGQAVMLVGHNPDLSELVGALTGARVNLDKAGLAAIEMDQVDPRRGELLLLAPRRFLRD